MIVALLNKVDTISEQFVLGGYQELVSAYTPAIYGMVALCVIVYGYATLQGWVTLSFAESGRRLLTIGIVLSLALNWGIFSDYIYILFTRVPVEIGDILIKALPLPSGDHINAGGIDAHLQQAWYDGIGYGLALWKMGGISNIAPYFWGAIIILLVNIFIGIALIELIVAKFGLAIFLVLSPLILPMMLFKPTKEVIFDGWLKCIVSFAFVPIFVTSALALGLVLLADSVTHFQQAIRTDTVSVTDTAPYVITALVCLGLVLKATQMAASIANGFSTGMSPYVSQAGQALRREYYLRHQRSNNG